MNAYRPSEPRYTIVISKTAKSSARYEIAKQSRRAALSAGPSHDTKIQAITIGSNFTMDLT